MVNNIQAYIKEIDKVFNVSMELPNDIDIEKMVLSQLISLNCIEKSKELLHEDLFYLDFHKEIFNIIMNVYEKNRTVNAESVIKSIKKEDRYNFMHIADMSIFALEHINHILHLKELHIWRRSIQFSYWIIEAFKAKEDVFDLFSILDKFSRTIKQEIEISATKPIDKLVAETLKGIEENANRGNTLIGITTGYDDLNSLTSGFDRANLIVLAARPSMGKTTFSLNLMYNAAKFENKNVVFFSLETKDDEISKKLLSMSSFIPYEAIRHNDIKNWGLLRNHASEIAELPILIEDVPGISIEKLDSRITKLCKINKCDMAIVDYAQLVSIDNPIERKANRESQVRYISNSLKRIASTNNIPVVALAQLNREVEKRSDKRPLLSDLRESGAIEQDADVIMFLYRDVVYNPDTEFNNKTEVIIAKNRNGKLGIAELKDRLDICKFEPYESF